MALRPTRGSSPRIAGRSLICPEEELRHEMDDGVVFWGWEEAGTLAGVMGLQQV